jgi:hypothetical protein
MGDIESEQFHYTSEEVEISDLDEPEDGTSSLPLSLLERRLRFMSRQRRLCLILFDGLLVLVVVFLLVTTTPVRELASDVFIHPTPSPTAALFPGVDLFYVRADPPWGRLLIDGHLTTLPAIGADPPLRLARGQHRLAWQAAPFLTQHCTAFES